jgi:putative hydrolase of the HAD superfamily
VSMPDDIASAARGLLLDIGGVIVRSGRELMVDRARHEPAMADYVTRTDFGGPGDARWQSMLAHEMTERAYWHQMAGEIGEELGHSDWETRDLIRWMYHAAEANWLIDDTLALMAEVKDAGLQLAALTNDMVDFHGQEWVDAQRWLDVFDVIVDGSLTGVLKPDPRAYRLAVEAMELPAHQIVYLDDMPVNVAAGAAAGLQAIEVLYADRERSFNEARRRLGLTVPTNA